MNGLSPTQLEKSNALNAYLNSWRQLRFTTYQYRQALATRDIQGIAGLFRTDRTFRSLSLCDFFGRPETQVVEMAVYAVLPPVYAAEAELLKEAITVVCRERGAERAKVLVGLGIAGVVAAIFFGLASGE